MDKNQQGELARENLYQLSLEQLVEMVVEQGWFIQELKKVITELEVEVQQLKVGRDLDSKTSSKPPSGDILKKSEKKEDNSSASDEAPKRKPGGQPGHPGKTRKGFGRTDRFEILRPQFCDCCGQGGFVSDPIKIETQQVAQLVECPIEIALVPSPYLCMF